MDKRLPEFAPDFLVSSWGEAILTPTGTRRVYLQNLTGNGQDTTYGSPHGVQSVDVLAGLVVERRQADVDVR